MWKVATAVAHGDENSRVQECGFPGVCEPVKLGPKL